MKQLLSLLLFPLIAFFFTPPAHSTNLTGNVINISDGDTITILDSNKRQHKIRLYGIDCPESGQPFGKAAKKHTAKLTAWKQVVVKAYDTDRYGRTVGIVAVNGVIVNQSLIENGYAWQYRKYCKASFCSDWAILERKAKVSRIGMWRDNDPIPPWQWRKGARNSSYKKTNSKYTASTSGYHGNVRSHKFHSSSCRHYNCKNCVKVFNSRDDAVSAGYKPCGMCRP